MSRHATALDDLLFSDDFDALMAETGRQRQALDELMLTDPTEQEAGPWS